MHVYLERAVTAIEQTLDDVSPARMAAAPSGRWSVAEILEHLTLAYRAGAHGLNRALASGQTRTRRPSWSEWGTRVVVVDVGYFPRADAPEMTLPTGAIAPDRARATAREALGELDAALTRAAERFGDGTAVLDHPYFAAMSVRQWRKFHWRHTVHHMRQARARAAV